MGSSSVRKRTILSTSVVGIVPLGVLNSSRVSSASDLHAIRVLDIGFDRIFRIHMEPVLLM